MKKMGYIFLNTTRKQARELVFPEDSFSIFKNRVVCA